jgi:hypothetical protein
MFFHLFLLGLKTSYSDIQADEDIEPYDRTLSLTPRSITVLMKEPAGHASE